MDEPTLCCRAADGYCGRCDLLVGLDGLHVVAVEADQHGRLIVTVESAAEPVGCIGCAVIACGHGRASVELVDAPAMGRPVRIVWRKRRWICREPDCEIGTFVERNEQVAAPRAKLTTRACRRTTSRVGRGTT